MSIQGSFNSMLSSLVYATSAARQARAQERIASAQEEKNAQKTELAARRLTVQEQRAATEAEKQASLAPLRESQAEKRKSEASINRAQAGAIREDTRGKKLNRKIREADLRIGASANAKQQLEQQAMDNYLERTDEIYGGREAVTNLKETIGEKRNG